MAKSIKWGISIPQIFPNATPDIDFIKNFILKAEELGYHSLWVQEHIEEYQPSMDPIGLLNFAATLTSRVKLGTSVLLPIFRNPVHLAKSLSTLDIISKGRFIYGVGLGALPEQYSSFGFKNEKRVKQFLEGLRVLKSLWVQDSTSFDGEFWKLNEVSIYPKPVQSPHPPIWFGGRHPDALKRAVLNGNGWIGAGGSSTETFVQNVKDLRIILDKNQVDPAKFPIAKRVYIALDNDENRAINRLEKWFADRYKNNRAKEVCVWGNPEKCIQGINDVIEAGAQIIQLDPVFDQLEQVESLKNDVIDKIYVN